MIISSNISELWDGINSFIIPVDFDSEIFRPYINKMDMLGRSVGYQDFGDLKIWAYDSEKISLVEMLKGNLNPDAPVVVICDHCVNEVELLSFAQCKARFLVGENQLDKLKLFAEYIC